MMLNLTDIKTLFILMKIVDEFPKRKSLMIIFMVALRNIIKKMVKF